MDGNIENDIVMIREDDQTMMNELSDYAGDGADIIREALLGGATTVRAVRVGDSDGVNYLV